MGMDFLYMRVAYAALLFIFVLCGVLRCLDFWTPLGGKNADELYPARRIVACIYFSAVLLLPCALHPQSADTRLLARCFWILFVPVATALGYKRFFFGDRRHKRLRVALVGGVPVSFALALSCIALAGGDVLLPYKKAVIHAAGILGALLTAYEIHVLIWLGHILSGADAAARAADKLFPKRFASGMFGVSLLVLAVTWWVFLFEGVYANAAFAGTIAFIGLLVLLVILHPQRVEKKPKDGKDKKHGVPVMVAVTPNGDTVQVAVPDGEQPGGDAVASVKAAYPVQPKEKKYTLSDAQLDSIERQIRNFVEGKKQYLDPMLTRNTLEEKLGVNRLYLSEVFARRFGSLNLYLNTLRMEQAIRYVAEHPNAKQAEVARHSGFGSDNSYYRAKRTYEAGKLSPEIQEADNAMDNSGLPE